MWQQCSIFKISLTWIFLVPIQKYNCEVVKYWKYGVIGSEGQIRKLGLCHSRVNHISHNLRMVPKRYNFFEIINDHSEARTNMPNCQIYLPSFMGILQTHTQIYIYVCIYIYIHIYIYIYKYIYIDIYYAIMKTMLYHLGLSPQWLCGNSCTWAQSCAQVHEYTSHHVPKSVNCHKPLW